jgi:hypothetical protein
MGKEKERETTVYKKRREPESFMEAVKVQRSCKMDFCLMIRFKNKIT